MRISIIHPSRSRPEMADATFDKWMSNCADPDSIEYILSIDASDPKMADYYNMFSGSGANIYMNDNKSAIEAINEAAKICKGDLIIVVSDDFDCPENWAIQLTEALQGKSDFIVKTQDGIQPTLITLPILDRVYYNRFGYIYEPSYVHMHSDEEMTCVAHMLGKVITLPILFKHNHYSTGGMKKDRINLKNDSTYPQGFKNITERKKINFGIKPEEIVKDWREIKWR